MQEVEVNLVITDYCMPGMTGYDLLKKIKVTISSILSFHYIPKSVLGTIISIIGKFQVISISFLK